jgi:hypothetical protein
VSPLRTRLATGVVLTALAALASAAPVSPERVIELCTQADGPAHCGRLIEAEQLKSLPNLAERDGDTLKIALFPTGSRAFVDSSARGGEKSYALWDYWSPVNAVVLFVTTGEALSYAVLQRATGQVTALPAEPTLAPDRQRVVVADFCADRCANELSIWRVTRDGLQRELSYRPTAAWTDVTATWKDAETLVVRYTPPGDTEARSVERTLAAADWKRP